MIEFDAAGEVLSIEEKPKSRSRTGPRSAFIFTMNDVVDLARTLKPSARGECEITDLNNLYIQRRAAQDRKHRTRLCLVRRRHA